MAYSDDIYKAKAVIQQDERVLQNEGNVVAVVNFMVRAFVKTDDYWGFYFDILPRLKTAVEEAGCGIPFPQRDVHLYQDK